MKKNYGQDKSENLMITSLNIVCACLLLLLSSAIFFTVITRYLLKICIPELHILIKFSVSWMVFLASAIALKENEHLVIDIISDKLSENKKCVLQFLVNVVVLVILLFLVRVGIYSFQMGMEKLEPINRRINQVYFYSSLSIGSIIMLVMHIMFNLKNSFVKIIKLIKKEK